MSGYTSPAKYLAQMESTFRGPSSLSFPPTASSERPLSIQVTAPSNAPSSPSSLTHTGNEILMSGSPLGYNIGGTGTSEGFSLPVTLGGTINSDVAQGLGGALSAASALDYPPVVIDLGSSCVRIGLAYKSLPHLVQVPAVVGRQRGHTRTLRKQETDDSFVGEEARNNPLLGLDFPIQHGVVKNKDDFDILLHHILYNELKCYPEAHTFLITEAALNPKSHREYIAKLLFETHNAAAVQFVVPASLAMEAYSQQCDQEAQQGIANGGQPSKGRSGIVLDLGEGVAQAVPVYDGHTFNKYHVIRQNFAGADLTEHMEYLLKERGVELVSNSERQHVRQLKEQLCYLSLQFESDYERAEREEHAPESVKREFERSFKLPTSQITVGKELFLCPEILFTPSDAGRNDFLGVHQMVFDAVNKCDINMRKALFENILLIGGTTLFPRFEERLMDELTNMPELSPEINFKLRRPKSEQPVWEGGALISQLESFQSQWIWRESYQNDGIGVIHKHALSSMPSYVRFT